MYFNKKTGYEGQAYTQKTKEAMCTELGPGKPYMQQFVEEAGETSLCSVETEEGCTDKEKKFIGTWKAKMASATGPEDAQKQITRLQGMSTSSMKEELAAWLRQRLAILKQFQAAKKEL